MIRDIDPQAPVSWRLSENAKSLYGHLKSIAALRQISVSAPDPMSLEVLLAHLHKLLYPYHDAETWKEDVARRVTDHGLGRW